MNFDYIKDRMDPSMNWYDKKSRSNKNVYLAFTISEIILAAFIPFISDFHDIAPSAIKYIISLIGVILTILAGLSLLGRYQEKWINYRRISENIKKEKYLYLSKAHPYNDDDAKERLVLNTEFEIEREIKQWYNQSQKQKN